MAVTLTRKSLALGLVLALQCCSLELCLEKVSELFAHVFHATNQHGHEASAPSHSHDNEGQEGETCCDNIFTLPFETGASDIRIIVSKSNFPKPKPSSSGGMTSSLERVPALSHCISSISGSRDKYALSCLLHAPPIAHLS